MWLCVFVCVYVSVWVLVCFLFVCVYVHARDIFLCENNETHLDLFSCVCNDDG